VAFAILIFSYRMYFDWQQTNALKNRGITVYASVDSIYLTQDKRDGNRYYAIAEYNFKGDVYHKTFAMEQGVYQVNDTLILKIATDNGNPIYYKITGVKTKGHTLYLKQ
jgi:hypothetical protein